jgi:transposase-like protein
MQFFIAGTPARTAAELAGVNRNTANLFYKKLRKIIVHFTEQESPFFDGEIEVDESYFVLAESAKANGDGALPARFLYSDCSKETERFTLVLSLTPSRKLCCL